MNQIINRVFYIAKPLIPRPVQIALRRRIAQHKRRRYAHIWPIDPNSDKPPERWSGWPNGKKFALLLSHDVDTRKGYDKVLLLADLEEQLGFRSQFNFVPERYGTVEIRLLDELKCRGFGIGVHGLKHDGKLFSSKEIFDERAPLINGYLKEWGTKGFTTPSMIRNHDWMHALDMDYCVSTFDTDPFEPQSEGAGTIFPYAVFRSAAGSVSQLPDGAASSPSGLPAFPPPSFFIELPYTLVQDFTLFVILGEKNTDTWQQKLDWIASKGGMALLNSHPDYMNFGGGKLEREEYPVSQYVGFLKGVQHKYKDQYWHVLPSQIFEFWKQQF